MELLEKAIAEVADLPHAAQEKIGREPLAYAEKLRRISAEIDQGIRSLDTGLGRELDFEDVVRYACRRQSLGRALRLA